MSDSKFPKLIDYEALKSQFGEQHPQSKPNNYENDLIFDHSPSSKNNTEIMGEEEDQERTEKKRPGLTGSRLRSYAFAVLTRKEYSKLDLIEKLALYAENREEVLELVEELARENYQSDQRVAEIVVRSQIRRGKGPNRIKLALNAKKIDKSLAQNDIQEIDWYQQAYQLKVKKYGLDVATDPKLKAKQIRFLQYRGFEMDAIMKAIRRNAHDDE